MAASERTAARPRALQYAHRGLDGKDDAQYREMDNYYVTGTACLYVYETEWTE